MELDSNPCLYCDIVPRMSPHNAFSKGCTLFSSSVLVCFFILKGERIYFSLMVQRTPVHQEEKISQWQEEVLIECSVSANKEDF